MPPPIPSLSDLQRLADTALGHLAGPGQALAAWERVTGREDRVTVTYTSVQDGRAWAEEAEAHDDAGLARAAKAVVLKARSARAWPCAGLPDRAPALAHDGFDPAVLEATEPGPTCGAARVAIASTRGVRAVEERTFAEYRAVVAGDRRTGVASAAAIGPGAVDAAAVEALAAARAAGDPEAPPDEELPVVLGPQAVAWLLDRLRPAFGVDLALGHGPLAGRLGSRVAAPVISLSDSPRHPGTLPRSIDAEGVPRSPVPLIDDGVAAGQVHDTASAARTPGAATTGHATQAAALAPIPENLVLAGGGAKDLDALCAGVRRGIYVPVVEGGRALAPDLIRDGERTPLRDADVEADPLAVIASVEALTASQELVRLRGHCPGGPGAAVVPALRAGRGLRLRS